MTERSSPSDRTLSALLEGTLPAPRAEELRRRIAADPALSERLALLGQILAEPVTLEPIEPPGELLTWLQGRLAAAADDDDRAGGAVSEGDAAWDDPADAIEEQLLARGAALDPVAVPADLERWVRSAARAAAEGQPGAQSARAPRERRGAIVLFATPARAAAALLVALGLGLAGGALGWSRGGVQEVELERALASAAEAEAEARAVATARAERERAAAVEAQRERLAAELRAQAQELAAVRGERDALGDRVAAGERALARAERLAAEAGSSRDEALARAERLEGALAASAADPSRGRAVALRVGDAAGVERWDAARGWRRVEEGDAIVAGAVLRGRELSSRLRAGERALRLGRGLFIVGQGGELQPLPSEVAPHRSSASWATRRELPEPGPPQPTGILATITAPLR